MATNLALDDRLIATAQRIGAHRTKRETVNCALEAYIRHQRQLAAIEKFGTIEFDRAYNYRRQRRRA